jgi:hypothetical protein
MRANDMTQQRLKPVWGAEKIGEILDTSPRQTFYLLEKGLVPARKIGNRWQSTEKELEDFLRGGAVAATTPDAA